MPRENFEDEIFSNIEESTGDTFNETPVNDNPTEPDEVKDQKPEAPEPNDNSDVDLFGNKETKQPKPEAKKDQNKTQNDGHLRDANGNIVARAGSERRLYEANQRITRQLSDERARNVELAKQLAAKEAFDGLPKQLGINDNDTLRDGLALTALFLRDPKTAAREVIAKALAAGVNLNQIIDDEFVPNVSTAAMKEMLDKEIKPLTSRLREQQMQAEAAERVNQEVQRFVTDFPLAEVHQQDIADMMPEIIEEFKGEAMTPRTVGRIALDRIVAFCKAHNLDPNRPIGEQVGEQAASRGRTPAPNGGATTGPRNPRNPSPMPTNGARGNGVQPLAARSASASMSTEAIIREAMREAGMDLKR